MTIRYQNTFFGLLCLASCGISYGDDKITLNYNERPPYLVPADDGSASGLTATPAANAFKAAGVAFNWAKIPPNKQLSVVQENTGQQCAIGWYKNSEREGFAKFTKPIYRDKPNILLANKSFKGKDNTKLEDLLSIPGIKVLVKEKFSYGPFIDGLLAKIKPTTIISNGSNSQMLQLINAKTADFMFVSEEEAHYLVEQASLSTKDFQQIKASDMPGGGERYIMCSKSVPDEIIAKLNKVINFK